jgi:hypothetical protein
MAHYYSTIQGGRGTTSRCGTKSSGIKSTINSWSVGAEVRIRYSESLNKDIVDIYSTRGSNTTPKRIMSYTISDSGSIQVLDTEYPELLI